MTATTQQLTGKHALVTGGARGIGGAISKLLLAHGARVTTLGRDRKSLEEAAHSLRSIGSIRFVVADVTDQTAVQRAFGEASSQSGRIDILINNAGRGKSAPFLKTDAQLWREMMSVNLEGTLHCMQAALPAMIESGWGRIVNVASVAGLTGYRYVSAYCAAKHAVVGLTRSVALEVATKGITVNAVCPGYTDTAMTRESVANIAAKTGRSDEVALAELTATNPQKRLITPEEVANAVAWLCLPGSEAITGQAVAIAGGEVM
jgi:NAD(P)-dependent dehydrogenase (short-subunit alcohol dehydrogenase family)